MVIPFTARKISSGDVLRAKMCESEVRAALAKRGDCDMGSNRDKARSEIKACKFCEARERKFHLPLLLTLHAPLRRNFHSNQPNLVDLQQQRIYKTIEMFGRKKFSIPYKSGLEAS